MKKALIFSVFFLIFSACNPSFQLLQKFEVARNLSNDILWVQLYNEDEQIDLFRKYNNHKKADRLEQKIDNLNQIIKKAFENQYDYTQVKFTKQDLIYQEANNLNVCHIFHTTVIKNETEVNVLRAELFKNDWNPDSEYKVVQVDVEFSYPKISYPVLVRKLDAHIKRLFEKSSKHI